MTPTEARGVVRRYRMSLAQEHARLARAFETPRASKLAAELRRRTSTVGRQRALRHLHELFTPAARRYYYDPAGRVAVWGYLNPRDRVIQEDTDPGFDQPCITVEYVAAGVLRDDGCDLVRAQWSLELPDHALRRLVERDPSGGTRLTDVIHAAHANLLSVPLCALPADLTSATSLYLPAGSGVFAGNLLRGRDPRRSYQVTFFRARTWLHEDQLGDRQVPLPRDRSLPTLGDGPLRPPSLRKAK